MTDAQITLKYSCAGCGLYQVELDVPIRESPRDDLIAWMNSTAEHVGRDHHARSPACRSTTMSELMIPYDDRQWVGGPIVQ